VGRIGEFQDYPTTRYEANSPWIHAGQEAAELTAWTCW
jgi:hypothetical protein